MQKLNTETTLDQGKRRELANVFAKLSDEERTVLSSLLLDAWLDIHNARDYLRKISADLLASAYELAQELHELGMMAYPEFPQRFKPRACISLNLEDASGWYEGIKMQESGWVV